MGKIRMYDKKYMNDKYLDFLYSLVKKKSTKYTYRKLFDQLFETDFYWDLELDANRATDGIAIRSIFADKHPAAVGTVGFDEINKCGCSVLEMLLGLANRMNGDVNFNTDNLKKISANFWILLNNLGIGDSDDIVYDRDKVYEVLNTLLNREYDEDGTGGLFPLKNAEKDQKKVEIWYQMQSFLIENEEL